MARPQIVLSLAVEQDIALLFDWIAADSGVQRAEAVLRRIEHTTELLAAMPRVGRVRRDLDGEPRTFSVWPWIIIYDPLPEGDGIVVWRVVDGRRDLSNEL